MLKTIILLLVTLIVLPVVAIKFDKPLNAEQGETLKLALDIFTGVFLTCFVIGEITGNCSQVDKLWSIMPIVYAVLFAYKSNWQPRLVLMLAVVTIWGLRLTYNFGRKGGYSLKFWGGEEDYRWNVLRQNPLLKGRLRWMLFNFFFITFYQLGLVLLFTLPMLVAITGTDKPLEITDWLIAAIMVGFVIIETIADQQQWSFQTEKYRRKNSGEALTGEYSDGFVQSGLWGLVRHPNYAAEQGVWITFYFFSVSVTGHWINWSMAGCLLLVLLFQGSADFSEEISAKKYPQYKDYQQRVPKFLPGF